VDTIITAAIIIGVITTTFVIIQSLYSFAYYLFDLGSAMQNGHVAALFFLESKSSSHRRRQFSWYRFLKPFVMRPHRAFQMVVSASKCTNFLFSSESDQESIKRKLKQVEIKYHCTFVQSLFLSQFGKNWTKYERLVFFMFCLYLYGDRTDACAHFFENEAQFPRNVYAIKLIKESERCCPHIIKLAPPPTPIADVLMSAKQRYHSPD